MSQDIIETTNDLSPLDPPSVPFWIEVYEGLGKTEGLIRFKYPNLILEFSTRDDVIGFFKSDVKEVTLPLASVAEIELKSNAFRTKLVLRANTLKSLEGMPGSKQGMAELRVKRKHKDAAASLVSSVSLRLSELRLQQLDNELNRPD